MRRVVACGMLWAAVSLAEEPKFELNGDAKKGETVYKQVCNACHGPAGLSNGPASVALNPKPKSFADPEFIAAFNVERAYSIVKEGGVKHGLSPVMAPMSGALNDQQLRDVTAYVVTLVPPPPATPAKPDPKKKK